jgi:phage FluMu gp28-like protein
VDQTGIGRQFLERAQARFGTAVEGVQFTQNTKETLAYNLKTHIEQRTLRLPCDEKLISDLLAVRISEDMRLTAQHGSDGHADRFWALALALHADRKQSSSSAVAELFHFQRPTACF